MARGAPLALALLALTALPLAALPAWAGLPCPGGVPPTADGACHGVVVPLVAGLPKDSEHLFLVGSGQARVALSGEERACQGPSQLLLEAGRKPGGFEPTATLWYGGARQGGAYLLPCAQGQLRQPMAWNLDAPAAGFAGAWGASFQHPTYAWRLDVGAPVDGVRAVSFRYASTDGLTRHDFDGLAYDLR